MERQQTQDTQKQVPTNVSAAAATIGVWVCITTMCIMLGGQIEAPMIAGTMTTIVIWALQKME